MASLAAGLLGATMVASFVGGLGGATRAAPSSSKMGHLQVGPGDVVINEVAWMGTVADYYDEWLELYNTSDVDIDLAGWSIAAADGTPDISLSGVIPAHGYFLLERTNDDAVADIPADLVYTGGLQNSPDAETLTLYGDGGEVIDTVNGDGGAWPAGDNDTKRTMERIDPLAPGSDDNWCTNDGVTRNGMDTGGHAINGTPKARNSCYQPPPAPAADLSVAKRGPIHARPGELITYGITVSNLGSATASAALLTDTLPAAVSFVAQSSPFAFTSLGGELVWQLGDVSVGTTHLITAVGRITETAFGPAVNTVTATTTASETIVANNSAVCTTTVAAGLTYFPLVFRDYGLPRYGVIIEAVLYDGLQPSDYDEAVLLLNGEAVGVDLSGWALCKWTGSAWRCADLPSVTIAPGQRLWLARKGISFARSFGFPPDHVLSSWPWFTNAGDEVALLDADGAVRDVLVYEDGLTDLEGWHGAAVEPYGGTNFAAEGQILTRRLDERSGLPVGDTDTAADWAQYLDDPQGGRRVRYPGWDLERFFKPALGASGTVTAGIAPDNAYQLVVDTIRSAEARIEVEAYTLEHYGLVMELVERANEGVRVSVLLEGGPAGGLEDQELWACQQLHGTGYGSCAFMVNDRELYIFDRYTYLHAKFIIVDRERVLIGSQNFNHSGLPGDEKGNGTGGSRGVVVVTDAAEIVARAVEVFEADHDADNHADISIWGPDNELGYGSPPPGFAPDPGEDWVTYTVQFPETVVAPGTWFELLTAPESALRGGDALLGLVGRAGTGDAIYVEQLYETREWGGATSGPNLRLEAYVDAARRGARVRILLNGGSFDLEYLPVTNNVETVAYVNEIARSEGLDLSACLGDPTQYGIHNKMVLVDLGRRGQYAHVGSINGSETSNKINREMALQVRSMPLFNYLYAMFEYDWDQRSP
ncbi:MAG: lamin tail domain-containing protein [Chloroflexota bacterium]